MTIPEFIAKWHRVELKERSAAQEHFIDLCNLFDHPTPAAADPTGESFCFEKGAAKHEGGDGFADVWKRGFFSIEYKGKHKDLGAAYTQLLPDMIFSRLVKKSGGDPVRFCKTLGQLFEIMATGGDFGLESIRHFNGNLFDDCSVLDLTEDEVKRIATAADLDWSAVDPSIFGTLFERGLDPDKRAELGAHFTGREDIEMVVDAVMTTELCREWDETRDPILRTLSDNIRLMYAIISDGGEPDWPEVDFIVGDPPFLGDKMMWREMGDDSVERVRSLYQGRLPGQSDLCCHPGKS